jgi:integrase
MAVNGDCAQIGYTMKKAKFVPKFDPSTSRWVVSIPPHLSKNGRRSRLYFADRADALRAARQLKERSQKFGTSLISLDPIRMVEAAEAYRQLDAHAALVQRPYSLLAIIQGHIHQDQQRNASCSLTEAFNQYLESREHLSDIHLRQIRSVQRRLKLLPMGNQLVSDIQPKDLEPILKPMSAGTANRYKRILRSIFNYAIKKGYATENPILRMDFVKLPKKTVRIFSNREIAGMLNVALKQHLEILPYFCVCAFAGLRSGSPEVSELSWNDIKFEEKTIVVPAHIAKTGKRRFVPMSDNLIAWLKLYLELKTSTMVEVLHKRVIRASYHHLRYTRAAIYRQVSPNRKWISAGLRHTYASAMINSGRDISETCLALGHSNPTMLWNHYHLATSKEIALAFWEIYPPS